MKKYNIIFLLMLTLTMFNCVDKLEIENTNDPDKTRLLSDPSAIEASAAGLLQGWFVAEHAYESPNAAMSTMADNITCSWGNMAMRDVSSEPRVSFNNTPSYGNLFILTDYFNRLYSVVGSANDVTTAVELNGVNIGENQEAAVAVAYLAQGLTFGSIALVFDKGYAVTELTPNEEVANPIQYNYNEMAAFAMERLDIAISLLTASNFDIPDGWVNCVSYTSTEMAEFASTYAARLLSNLPRNKADNAAVDWNRVAAYAANGVQKDFAPIGNGAPWNGGSWYDEQKIYQIYGGWARVDMRVVNMLDAAQPDYWPEGGYDAMPDAGVMSSSDARAVSDFEYLSSQAFRVERGAYHFSTYRSQRYDQYITTYDIAMPDVTVAENELYKAEAMLNMGDVAGAAAILNSASNARKSRGGLSDVSANADAVKAAIHYERNVEIILTGNGLQFFEMRKNDLLQKGTPLHFPVPAKILEVIAESFYTYGGTTGVAGEDYSSGGWR